MTTYITPLFSYKEFMEEMQRCLGSIPMPMPYTDHCLGIISGTLKAMLNRFLRDGQLVRIPEVYCTLDKSTYNVNIGFTREFEWEVMESERPKITTVKFTGSCEV